MDALLLLEALLFAPAHRNLTPLLPAGTHNNLLSNINVGRGTRPFQSGGASYRGAHSGERVPHRFGMPRMPCVLSAVTHVLCALLPRHPVTLARAVELPQSGLTQVYLPSRPAATPCRRQRDLVEPVAAKRPRHCAATLRLWTLAPLCWQLAAPCGLIRQQRKCRLGRPAPGQCSRSRAICCCAVCCRAFRCCPWARHTGGGCNAGGCAGRPWLVCPAAVARGDAEPWLPAVAC